MQHPELNREDLVAEVSRIFGAIPAIQMTGAGGIRQAIIEDVANAARSLQAAENAWRRVDAEFGLLSSGEIAELLGGRSSNRNFASSKRTAGKILGVLLGNAYRFPGFQLAAGRGTVLPVIEPLIRLARAHGWSEDDLALWLTAPSSFFAAADRPVDHLAEHDKVLAAAKDEIEAQ